MLLVHGGDDEVVHLQDARWLADATDGKAELRIVPEPATACVTTPGPSPSSSAGWSVSRSTEPSMPRSIGPVDGPSMAWPRAVAAALGSADSVSHRTTTKWRAPAATMSPTVVGVTPPVTNHGRVAPTVAAA